MPDKEGSDDEKTTKGVVNKKQKQMMGEEGYDILRDMGRVKPSKDKKDATTMPVSDEVRKTQKVNTGPSALDRVLKKYGKSVMNVEKKSKKKANEELDLTKIAEAFGGYLLEKKSPEELAAAMKRKREEKFPKKTKPLSDAERAKQDFEKARSQRGFMSGDDFRYKSQESEFDTEGKTKSVTPKQQKKDSKPEGKVKLDDTTVGGPVKNIKGEPKKVGTSTRADRAKETTLLKKIERETPNVQKPFLDPGSDIDDFIKKGPQPDETPKRKSFKVNPKGRQKDKSGGYFAKRAQKGSKTESEVQAEIKPTPNVRFAAPAGSGKPVTRQVKEPTDKQRRAQYKQKFDKSYSDFTRSGGKTDAPGGVLPGGKFQPPMDDATKEYNRQQNILRRFQRQGMADSGATPFKQPPFPDPKTGPSSKIKFNKFQQNRQERDRQERVAQNKKDEIDAALYRQTPEYKSQAQGTDEFGNYLSPEQRKRNTRRQRGKKSSSKKGEIENQTPKLDASGGFEQGREGTLTRNKKSPNVETMTDKIGKKIGDMARKTQTAQQSTFGALGGFLTKTVSRSAAGAEAGMRFYQGDKTGATLSALQSMGGGIGFGAGVLNAIRSVRAARTGKTAGIQKAPNPEQLGMAAAAGGYLLPKLGELGREIKGGPIISPVRGGRAGRRSAKQ